MSTSLAKSTCLIHPARPATARCPSCGDFYCGECITEHDGQLTCARCLAARHEESETTKPKRRRLPVAPLVQIVAGLVLCWLIYYSLAQVLLSVPADFHDGTVWE